MQKKIFFSFILLPAIFILIFLVFTRSKKSNLLDPLGIFVQKKPEEIRIPTPIPSPTPSPTPKPLTFNETNELYGPCVYLPTLMYHHVQDPKVAAEKNQSSISVDTEVFRSQMKYLKDKGYKTLSMADLIAFFDSGVLIPKKSILLTFDDGYEDFYTNAYPILKENGQMATMFLATGLVNNFGYLNWSEISEMSGSGIYFANHTWSHKNVFQEPKVVENEISTAAVQLAERDLDNLKVFAYPYGSPNKSTETYLTNSGFKLGFTTKYGTALCIKQRYELPRLRIGNKNMSSYGF